MSEVKRYSFWPQIVHLPGGGGVRAEVHFKVEEDGLFVAHQDYDRLKSEVEAQAKRWAESEDLISHYKQQMDEAINDCQCSSLKAEVERLKAVSTIEQRTIQGLQRTPEWSEIARLTAECRRLDAENSRLRSSSFVTAVPVEQYERLKAEVELWKLRSDNWQKLCQIAKEGKPSV